MEFEGLSSRLQGVFRKLRGKGKLSAKDMEEALREVRLSLLEADVNFKVVREFIASVRERSLGADVLESLTPAQQVIKIVNQELIELLGGRAKPLDLGGGAPAVVALFGLQGSGKTTVAGKLAYMLGKSGRKVMLVSCDIYRPAAQRQLEILAKDAGASFFTMDPSHDPAEIAKQGYSQARTSLQDVVVIDTAGRTQLDQEMMTEARRIRDAVGPRESLLVVDSMTGQEACTVAQAFDETVGLTGIVLTKIDSDARGGAALSITKTTGKPVKFASSGERLQDFGVFHPDRMASRILGMGDVLTLIEKAEASFSEKQAAEMEQKLRRKEFTLDDFVQQMKEVKKMGSLGDLLRMIPGMGKVKMDVDIDPKEWGRLEAMISSMTPLERRKPEIIDGSRKRRIARGSGTKVQDVNRLLRQFSQAKRMLFGMSKEKLGKFRLP